MLNKIILLVLTTTVVSLTLCGQEDISISLDEIILSDAKLEQHAAGSKLLSISDTLSVTPNHTFTDLLRYQSTIYFRENGYGAVSSASLRGTSASQTAVVWNGININSQLTGQTDFNTMAIHGQKDIKIRHGGGSAQYASGAIGGSIHLNDVHKFNTPWTTEIGLGYGAFDTYRLNYGVTHGSEKLAIALSGGYINSKNDYAFLGTDRKNENGAFNNANISISGSYLLAQNQVLKVYQNAFSGDRQFPFSLTAPSDDKYQDHNSRSLIDWSIYRAQSISSFKLAYLYERFRYFPNRERPDFQQGQSKNIIAKYDHSHIVGSIRLNGIAEYNHITADGSSIINAERKLFAGSILLTHQLSEKLSYGLNLRRELVSDYSSPVVYAIDSRLQLNDQHMLQVNASKNYRIPTFNDLYWSGPGATGNEGLVPETSMQAETSYSYQAPEIKISSSIYYISTANMIQWSPDVRGIWSPNNVQKTRQYGLELSLAITKKIQDHQLSLNQQYAFVRSINADTSFDLIYVPRHKTSSNLSYQYESWSVLVQSIYNGPVYTTTDSSSALDGYFVSNAELSKHFQKNSKPELTIAVSMNNIFNKNYQNVAFRPMPNRHLQLQIQTKF